MSTYLKTYLIVGQRVNRNDVPVLILEAFDYGDPIEYDYADKTWSIHMLATEDTYYTPIIGCVLVSIDEHNGCVLGSTDEYDGDNAMSFSDADIARATEQITAFWAQHMPNIALDTKLHFVGKWT